MMSQCETIESVARCPFLLRVARNAASLYLFQADSRKMVAMLEGATASVETDGIFYVGFHNHALMTRALELCLSIGFINTRIIDPYALHIRVPRCAKTRDIVQFAQQLGEVMCVVIHEKKNRYAFINFMTRESVLSALINMNTAFKVRAKVLSRSEPFHPQPWSPARFV